MISNKNRMVQQVSRNLQSILESELNTKVPYTQARRIVEKLDVEFTKNKEKSKTSSLRKKSSSKIIIDYNKIPDKSLFKLPLGVDDNGNIKYWDWMDNNTMLITGTTGIGKSELIYNIISYLKSLPDDYDMLYLHTLPHTSIKNSRNINSIKDFINEISQLLNAGPRDKPLFLFLDDIIFMNRIMDEDNSTVSDEIFQFKIHLESLLSIARSYNIIIIATLQNPEYACNYFFFNYKLISNYHGQKKIITIYPGHDDDFAIEELLKNNSNRDIINTVDNKIRN